MPRINRTLTTVRLSTQNRQLRRPVVIMLKHRPKFRLTKSRVIADLRVTTAKVRDVFAKGTRMESLLLLR
ncbi:hypothetical protein G9C98_005863 [Cotesia typhae]|uniref:Uncharacterized protein n=1 Tax=Cotesia typhae TaxID=2053667 RepID=A0A8J5URE3_9HYME|nr:hypothetical protein G9C98_005863 [Cotesia typhae]